MMVISFFRFIRNVVRDVWRDHVAFKRFKAVMLDPPAPPRKTDIPQGIYRLNFHGMSAEEMMDGFNWYNSKGVYADPQILSWRECINLSR